MQHYKWYNFAQQYSVLSGADTYDSNPQVESAE
jgi:hypothetical protein